MRFTKQLLLIYDKINRRNLLKEYTNIIKTLHNDLCIINEYQQNNLKSILEYAAGNVPFYRRVFNECRLNHAIISPSEIMNRLPVITKDLIQTSFEDFLSDEYRNTKKLIFYHTGGSTGQPAKIAVDKNYLDIRWAVVFYNLTWVGYKLGDCHGFIYGSNLDAKEQCSFRQKCQNWMTNAFHVNAFHLNNNNLKAFTNECIRKKPKFLIGYASALLEFANYIAANDLPIHIEFVESTAEYLSPEVRKKIETIFNCNVYDRYGCREVGNIAHECKIHDGQHINWQTIYVEIINKGKYLYFGPEYGDIVITCLKNKGMPLIRYFVGDIGRIDYSPCRCGMSSPRLYLGGTRSIDILYTTDSHMVSASPLSLTTRDLYSIKKIQYVQKSIKNLEINVVTDHTNDNNVRITLEDRLKKIFGNDMEIRFNFVEEIKREISGKYRLTKRLF